MSGKEVQTSKSTCTCQGLVNTGLPCKHMLRLYKAIPGMNAIPAEFIMPDEQHETAD